MKRTNDKGGALSVIMPAYNSERTIERAIDSVFIQKADPLEIIVVDDGSQDGTARKVRRYGRRVRYVRGRKKGVSAARNLGLKISTQPFIAFLDSDDQWLPGKWDHQRGLFRRYPEAVLTATGMHCVDPEGRLLRTVRNAVKGEALPDLMTGNFLATSTVAVRREALRGMKEPFRTGYSYGEDYLLWVELALRGPFWVSPKVLVNYTESTDSRFVAKYSQEDIQRLYLVVEKEVGDRVEHWELRKLRSKMHLELALWDRRKGETQAMMRETLLAMKEYPWLSSEHQKQVFGNILSYFRSWIGGHE